MSGAPAVVMVWDIGKWWFRKEDGKVALVNNGEDLGTVEDILEGNTFGSLKTTRTLRTLSGLVENTVRDGLVEGTSLVSDITQEHRSCRPGRGNFPRVGHHTRTPFVSAWSSELPSCRTSRKNTVRDGLVEGTSLVSDITQEHRSCRPGRMNFPRVGHHTRTPFVTAWSRELPSCVTWQGTLLVTDCVHEHRS
ncbi:AT-rich interactive domain-containing protein 2 [Branchiostoma belcheri]|nr:AT-rich interactive domain-containing protein 2 [Branchiostoma belcheri]